MKANGGEENDATLLASWRLALSMSGVSIAIGMKT